MAKIDQTQAAIIATLILFPEKIEETAGEVPVDWFTGNYKRAYAYIIDNNGADQVAVAAACGLPTGEIEEWMDTEFSASFLPRHIVNLENEHSIRKLRYLGQQLTKTESVEESRSLIDRYTSSFSERDKTEPVTMKDGLKSFVENLEARYQRGGAIQGITYGLTDLDAYTEGMHKGDLVIVAAPSSMGKTAFAVGVAESAAVAGHKVMIFSCEMTVDQVLARSVSAHSGVYLKNIRSAKLEAWDWSAMLSSVEQMARWPITIDDPSGISLSELTRKVRKAAKAGLDVVVVDYLQIMKYDKSKEVQELDTITVGLKHLAKELGVCMILLSQLNRGNEKDNRKPQMTDLRGSGAIENHSDVILFPWRPAAKCELCQQKVNDEKHNTAEHQALAEIIIGKQRQGERNVSVPVVWIGRQTRFVGIG